VCENGEGEDKPWQAGRQTARGHRRNQRRPASSPWLKPL